MGKGWLRRVIYGVVGLTAVYTLFWMFFKWAIFMSMPMGAIFSYVVLTIGGLNWLPVAFTGDGNKDLLHLVGLRK